MKYLYYLLVFVPTLAFGEVGSVTEFSGNPAQANRQQESLIVEMGFSIEMLDQLITANTRMGLTFEDGTRAEITEQSELVIDDFVYDPNTGAGKMSMKVALGTVQMASGRMAKTSRENISIKTPTASITVRGTSFSMTVDELGRSLIINLPIPCPDPTLKEDECPSGAIEVSTDVGSVVLDKPWLGTMVSSSSLLPADPRRLLLDNRSLNNDLIIVPPAEFPKGFSVEEEEETTTALDVDLLEYQELSQDFLDVDLLKSSALDINRLSNDFLENLLDLSAQELDDALNSEKENEVLPTINKSPWIQWVYNEDFILLDSERPPHIAVVTTGRDTNGIYNLLQDEQSASIQINDGGSEIFIKVIQKQ
jgi:hypothetical protein